MKNRSRLLTVLLYIVVFAVAVVLISEVFFRDDAVYVNYSTVCEQFRSENVRSFEYDNGVLTLELRKPYQNEAYSVSHKLADLGLFYEDLGTLIAEQQESGVLQSYNYVPMRQTPWYVRMLPEMLLSVIMIALVYMVLVRNSGGMMKFGHANARVGSGRDKVMFSDVAGADEEKAELQEIVKLVGQDALSPADNLTLESAKMIREDFLQQNAFLENDQYSSFDRQARLLDLILRYKDLCDAAIERGADIWKLYAIAARAAIGRAKTVPADMYQDAYAKIVADMEQQIEEVAKEAEAE